jgi:hypothetical protein
MKRFSLVLSILMIVLTAAQVRASEGADQAQPQYTGAQIKQMVREAHTVEQYTALADYYATRQRMFKRKAVEQMHLWAMRSTSTTPLSEKWPRPVDSARNLHDYYEYEASRSAALQAKYSRLADEAAAK